MTTQEFSDQFDVLYNNITSNQAPGLNEYEKSVFLTKAQDELVKNYFMVQSNQKQAGFDDNQKRQADFATLINTIVPEVISDTTNLNRIDARSTMYTIENAFLILNEQLWDTQNNTSYVVIPLSYSEYSRLMSKPYKYPVKGHFWRLVSNSDNDTPVIELIGRPEIDENFEYRVRYVRRPRAIRLVNFDTTYDSVTIDGGTEAQTSELPPHLHEEILQRAVELAKVAWAGDLNSTVQMGNRSE